MHLLYGMQTNMRSHNEIRNNGKGEVFLALCVSSDRTFEGDADF